MEQIRVVNINGQWFIGLHGGGFQMDEAHGYPISRLARKIDRWLDEGAEIDPAFEDAVRELMGDAGRL